MGAGLGKAAYEAARRVGADHAPVRAYVYMALTALDDDPQPKFYGGRESLADALGKPSDDAGFRAVTRATDHLTSRGLIVMSRRQAPGRNARFDLLDGAGQALQPDTRRSPSGDDGTPDAHRPVNTRHSAPEHRTVSIRTPDAHRPVEEERKKQEEARTSAPTRTCQRHTTWTHNEPCRACAADKRAADARRPASPSPERTDCGSGRHHWMPPEHNGARTCKICPIQWRDGENEP